MPRSSIKKTRQAGFFLPALLLALLIMLFLAILFGARLLERSDPVAIEYSARYHELNARESLNDAERAELEVERCRYERALLDRLQPRDSSRYEQARARYDDECGDRLPR